MKRKDSRRKLSLERRGVVGIECKRIRRDLFKDWCEEKWDKRRKDREDFVYFG